MLATSTLPVLSGLDPLLGLALVLVAGFASGRLARRVHLPSVTGQIVVGVLLGPVFHVFGHDTVQALAPITHFALGLMAVAVGSHLVLPRLRNALKRLSILVLLEATLTPVLVYAAVLVFSDAPWHLRVLLGTIAVSTAPATILAVVKEARAKGVFVKTLVAAVALNNIACIALFELAHTAVREDLGASGGGVGRILLAPVQTLVLSGLLGAGAAVLLLLSTRNVVRADRLTTLSIMAILLTAGLADHLGLSTLLACLFLGVALANLTPEKEEIGHGVFENFENAIFAVFFTLAGLELRLDTLAPAGVLALAVFLARMAGKTGGAWLAMRAAGAPRSHRHWLGMALLPQAGLAVGLMLLVTEEGTLPSDLRDLFLAVVLSVVLLNELAGPVLCRLALARSGDLGKDRPRVMDFLHEENIVTDLAAGTKEEAIRRLVDVLVRSNQLSVDREALVSSILAREALASTCVGGGLAVPHGELPGGSGIVGAMGISHAGLHFDAVDGQPVHCMVLLATPATARTRHLEVLAALARAFGHDEGVRQQLFRAKSPAHAYELLHADDAAEDFNRFLETADDAAGA